MGDIGLELRGRERRAGDAAEVLVEAIRARPGELTLVTLGPLTNVARAFELAPDVASKLRSLVMMGGTSDAVGNVSPVAEFNIWADPGVRRARLRLGCADHDGRLGHLAEVRRLRARRRRRAARARPARRVQRRHPADARRRSRSQHTRLAGFDLPDPIAMAVALDPAVATDVRRVHVAVERRGELTRGQTVVDHDSRFGDANADVVFAASRERFLALLHDALRS